MASLALAQIPRGQLAVMLVAFRGVPEQHMGQLLEARLVR
jgi:hypothetical protein